MGLIKSQNDTTNINQFVDDIRFLALNSSSDFERCAKGQNTTLPSDGTSICEISLLNPPEEGNRIDFPQVKILWKPFYFRLQV